MENHRQIIQKGKRSAPIVALVYLSTFLYDQIFDHANCRYRFCIMPLGLMYLSATLKQYSSASDIFVIDYTVATSKLLEKLIEGRCDLSEYRKGPEHFIVETAQAAAQGRVPDVIGVSLMMSTTRSSAIQIVEQLSRLWPDALVVFGGNHATNDVSYLLCHPDIDFVCRGEADWAFPKFVNALAHSDEPVVKGFYSKRDIADGKSISINCDYPENLDELPFPDWDLIDVDTYIGGKHKRNRDLLSNEEARVFSIMTSRGCSFNCTFCASYTVHGRKVRLRSVENVLAEMCEIYSRFGATLFIPDDDLFLANKQHTLALLAGIKGLGIPNLEIQVPNGLCVNTLDEEIIDALCEVQMKTFTLAIESGSPYTQQYLIKKRVNLDRARRLVKYANDRKLYTRINLIIGFPNEKMEHIQETIDFAKTLGADWNTILLATPLLGSEMLDQFRAMKTLDLDSSNWMHPVWERSFDTEDFKAEELLEIAYRLNLEVNFISNRQMRIGNWKLALEVFTEVIETYPFHIIAHYQILLCLENLGQYEEAQRCLEHIKHLVDTIESSADMLHKYGDMVPDLVERLSRFDNSRMSNYIKH